MRLNHAEELLTSLGIRNPSEIDLEAIAFYCGAEVREIPLTGCEAQITGYKDEAIITVNSNSSSERKRFSIGHELGHWKYHKGRSFICRSDDIGNAARSYSANDPEIVADKYSADLLMPDYLFSPLAKQAPNASFDIILKLKKDFSTSITATALKYIQHSNELTMLVCHEQNGRRWFKRGKDLPDELFPNNDLDADSFAMDVLYGRKSQTRSNKIGADAWFSTRYADRYEIYEHSIPLVAGQILTLLSWRDEEMFEFL
jgi:Zn-dependent peptidase ImmA (M78 family)